MKECEECHRKVTRRFSIYNLDSPGGIERICYDCLNKRVGGGIGD